MEIDYTTIMETIEESASMGSKYKIIEDISNMDYGSFRDYIATTDGTIVFKRILVCLGALFIGMVHRGKIPRVIKDKFNKSIEFIAEMIIWKAKTQITQLILAAIDECTLKKEYNEMKEQIIEVVNKIENVNTMITTVSNEKIDFKILEMCERKMIELDDQLRNIEKSVDRRISNYDWRITALSERAIPHIDIINQNMSEQSEAHAVQQHENKVAKVKSYSARDKL
uniref:Non-structural protein 4 n=1 Tax=Ruddy turnstone rotavirus TaxID=2212774 RepID=A0A3G1RPQ8_9REOV|nr:MAG: non-structural protein 4 [Ruddy turnstone rotavirus]